MSASAKSSRIAGNMDTGFLKLLALLFMLTDHIGTAILPHIPELRVIGRMALPLYAWCLVVGCEKTKNPLRYGFRLLLLAVISQPLYMMALNHTWSELGILFLLLIAFIAIQGIRLNLFGSQWIVPALCYLALGFMRVDYGWKGLTFILILYAARSNKHGLIAAYLAYALFWGTSSSTVYSLFGYKLSFLTWPGIGPVLVAFFKLQGMVWLSLPLIATQTHTGIKLAKWLGYGLYPLHLILLIIIKLCCGISFATLTQMF